MNIVLSILWAFCGFMTAQIAQRIIVPILVSLLGEKRFASPSAFDGCTLGIVGGIVAFALPAFLMAPRSPIQGPAWIVFPLIALGITLYGLVWLWALGSGAKKREWRIEENRILNRDDEELHPTFLKESSEYYQTDAFNGYSHYFLELHDNGKLLATNAYTSETEFKADAEQAARLVGALRLDLIWLHRVEPKKWQYVRFPDEWTTILCGSLERLSEDDRNWWHSWMLPQFTKHIGKNVDATDARERLKRLRTAYSSLDTPPDEPDAVFKRVGRAWADYNFELDRLLEVDGPIVALNYERFQELAHKAAGKPNGHVQMIHDTDGYATIH